MNLRYASALAAAAAIVATTAVAPSGAGVVTFDAAEGYNPFISLSGQTQADSSWQGAGNIWAVQPRDPGDPDSGEYVAQSIAPIGDGPFSNTRFPLTTSFLGTSSTSIQGDEVFDYSFELRGDAPSANTNFNQNFQIRLFDADSEGTAIRFSVFDTGVIQLPQPVGAEARVKNADGSDFDLDDRVGEFVTFDGSVDFATETFTLFVDGVQQTTAGGSSDFSFFQPGQESFGIVRLQRGNSTDSPHRQISVDNITLANQAAPLQGDYNDDGVVNIADYTSYRDLDGVPGASLPNETASIGSVDLADYIAWVNNFGAGSSTAQAIPEPAAVSGLLAGLGLLCGAWRR